jgi:crotonobetainyl-CoA:carnitine CoA-transferase CaiB-like acyl-CoA transferase
MLPLQGIRVLDLTFVWAGPTATVLLADLGAEVIKVESTARWDMRGPLPEPRTDGGRRTWYGRGGFHTRNRNKLGVTLDLSKEQGRALFLRLVRISDVVVENYSARVMANLGLDYPVLRSVRPDIVLVSMPGFGASGPYRDYPSWGETLDATSGIAGRTGYRDGPPLRSAIAFADPVGGFHGALATLVALHHRRATGEGQHIVLSQHEALTRFIAPEVLAASMTGQVPPRLGNRHPLMAPSGVYPCAGEDRWVAFAVRSDEEWARLVGLLGSPSWAREPRWATLEGRQAHHDELDARLAAWTSGQEAGELAERLRGVGIPASPVNTNREVLEDRHLRERGLFWELHEPEAGIFLHVGLAARLSPASGRPGSLRRPGPAFGEHNRYVLRDLLGLTEDEIQGLYEAGIVADEPPLPATGQQ